jgi:hypothetical protein
VNSATRLSQRGAAGALEITAATTAMELGIGGIPRGASVDEGKVGASDGEPRKLIGVPDATIFGGGVGISKPADVEMSGKVVIIAGSEGIPLIPSVMLKLAMTVGPARKDRAVGLAPCF